MKSKVLKLITVAFVVGLAACSAGSSGGITIKDAWARPTARQGMSATVTPASMGSNMTNSTASGAGMVMDGPVSAAYMVIENKSALADRLMSVVSSASSVAEVHETKQMDNGMMGMQPVQGGLEIPANGSVTLKPGSYHSMMMKLHGDLTPGQTIKLTLKFQSGKEITLDVPVKQP
jgi:copper(I)-binding protein